MYRCPAGRLAWPDPKGGKARKILLHINNTNPILVEDGPEHRAVMDAGLKSLRWHGDTTVNSAEKPMLPEAEFIAGFTTIGEERYHHQHPFHVLMHEGSLTRGQLQAWALNRYYYQSHIPVKDATLLARGRGSRISNCVAQAPGGSRRRQGTPGGIEKWLHLVEATGLPRIRAIRGEGILPATRYAVDAYINFVSRSTFLEAVASSLTELFSKKLIVLRMDRLREFYPWMSEGLDYFEGRLTQLLRMRSLRCPGW